MKFELNKLCKAGFLGIWLVIGLAVFSALTIDAAGNESAKTAPVQVTTLALPSNPPVISNGNPVGVLRGTSTAILSVRTNVPATCRYSASPGIPYASMTNTFSQTGGLYHSQILWNMANGQSYTRYIRCQDLSGSENTDDYVVSFSVIADTAPDNLSSIVVDSVGGMANDGELLTIQGSGFGAVGPSVLIFDDFEGGAVNADIPTNGAKVGFWDGYGVSDNPPTYSADAHSGQFAMQIRDASGMQQFDKTFPQPVQELYVSYWVRIPDGTNFPGAGGPNILPNASTWKMIWVFNGPIGFHSPNNDVILPAWPTGSFSLTGNDYHYTYINDNSWWTFSRYMRVSTWLKANGTNPLLPGDLRFHAFQDGVGMVRRMERTDIPIYDADDPTPADGNYYCTHEGYGTQWCQSGQPKQWDRMMLPGWLLSNGDSRRPASGDPALETPVYDDFYMAAGPGSQARVEIGDASTYSSSTHITIATPESWSGNTITARFRRGNFPQGVAYLYVIDADGNVNASGYPITIGAVNSGDLNGDDKVSIADIQACIRVILGQEANADIIQKAKELAAPYDAATIKDIQEIIAIILGG